MSRIVLLVTALTVASAIALLSSTRTEDSGSAPPLLVEQTAARSPEPAAPRVAQSPPRAASEAPSPAAAPADAPPVPPEPSSDAPTESDPVHGEEAVFVTASEDPAGASPPPVSSSETEPAPDDPDSDSPSESPTTPALTADRERYIAAITDRDAGDFDGAVTGLMAVVESGGPLAPVARMRLAQALVTAGRDAEAASLFALVVEDPDLPSLLRVIARLDGARHFTALDRTDEALRMLAGLRGEAAATSNQIAEARWRSALILRDRGDAAWSAEALTVVTVSPGSPVARQALDALQEAGIGVAPLTAGYVRYRARANSDATTLYESLVASEGAAPAASEAATAWFFLGALAERSGDGEAALDAYARSFELAPAGWLADDSLYWHGRVSEELGRPAAATADYDRLLELFPSSGFVADGEMRAALASALSGDSAEALDRFETITVRGSASAAALAARMHGVLIDLEPALGVGRTALDPAAFDPTALGALLDLAGELATAPLPATAWSELPVPANDWAEVERWLTARFGARPAPSLGVPVTEHRRFVLGAELAAVGEHAVARSIMRGLLSDLRGRPFEQYDFARATAGIGLYDLSLTAAVRILSRFSPAERLSTPVSLEQLAYPAPFSSALIAASEEMGTPPLLLLALTRQESAFNPNAGSHAGALGLTQVIPPTGALIARALSEPFDVDALFEPATALRFGAYYLAAQIERFDGNVLPALAAYNAGPGAAQRWLDVQALPGAEGYLFAVEFSETRRYLERVLENYAWYRYLYAGAERPSIR